MDTTDHRLNPSPPVAKDTSGLHIKLGPLDVPIPTWCLPVFGVLAILTVAMWTLSEPIQGIYSRYQLGKNEEQDKFEAYKHFSEPPKMTAHEESPFGRLEANLYADGCVSIAYKSGLSLDQPTPPHFIRKVDRPATPAPGKIAKLGSHSETEQLDLASLISTKAYAEPLGQPQCLNPHPPPFNTSYGVRNGCWVQVYRQFTDGCIHYQWLNTCSNVWDVNADGSPHVYWTQCRH